MKKILIIILILIVFINKFYNNNIRSTGLSESVPFLDGVTLRTELEYYAEGTVRILAYWENNTQCSLMFGESWVLEKYDEKTKKWSTVYQEGKDICFNAIGYILFPEVTRKHTYYITNFDENIKEGHYRIKTDFFNNEIQTENIEDRKYFIMAEFRVTTDRSLLKKSELDYDDLENSKEIWIGSDVLFDIDGDRKNIPVHVYKNKETYDTTIVINGEEQYKLVEGSGKWGVVSCFLFVQGKNEYLVYSYSRENEKKYSYIGVFDLNKKKEIYLSDAFEGYDICVSYREDNAFAVSYMEYKEYEKGGESSSHIEDIGYLKYKDGEFKLYKNGNK